MRLLFVHQNFPGQFIHLAPAMAARGHEVVALTAEGNRRTSSIRTYRYRVPAASETKGIARSYWDAAERGAAVARAGAQLTAQTGFAPDVIVGHGGWGETLFLRETWPGARIVDYAEFMYAPTGLDSGFDPEFSQQTLQSRIAVRARSAHLVQAIHGCDTAISPTEWQASTFPAFLRPKITVVHDGIDTEALRPDASAEAVLPDGRRLRAGEEILTFVSRQIEPYRGAHIFLRALPAVLAARPGAVAVIVGGDGQSYGPGPRDGRTWKETFLAEVGPKLDMSRVVFAGKVPYPTFRALMQVTRVHAYLTYPFVLSWSMLEAMSAGAMIVGSRTPPVEEVIQDGVNGHLVGFFDIAGWSEALIDALARPQVHDDLRSAARETALRYDLRRVCLPRLVDLVEGQIAGE